MSRMKTFFIYLVLFILFYMFVSVMTYFSVKSTMQNMENGTIEFSNPKITIEEAKKSRVNAVMKGKINVDKELPVQYKYVRVDFLSENKNILSSRFIDISDIVNGGEKDFSIKTNAENIGSYKITLTDKNESESMDFKWNEVQNWLYTTVLIWTIFN